MSNVFLKEERVKVQMINEILKYSDKYRNRCELESKVFSEIKFIYYDCKTPVIQMHRRAC